jgi:predicted phage tail protein
MSKITASQALQLAKDYNQSANNIGDFRLRNWETLSAEDRLVLGNTGRTLLDHSQDLITYAVGKTLDDTQASLNDIQKATADANQTIKAINEIKKVINIGAALATLAAAIYTESPSEIASALKTLVAAVSGDDDAS